MITISLDATKEEQLRKVAKPRLVKLAEVVYS